MKSYEEFRSAVFEKAEKYEARRKARNKKIAEAVSLCSLALVITLSAYLGLFPDLSGPVSPTDNSVATLPTDFFSDKTDGSFSDTTASSSMSETTLQSTATTDTSIESLFTSDTSETGNNMPIISKLEFRATAKVPNFAIGKTELKEIQTYDQWQIFLEAHTEDYPSLEQSGILLDTLDDAYFEENTLVIIQYAGYDIIAFGSDLPIDPSASNEKYMLYINLRENKSNYRKQIHIMSVDKDSFKGAEIHIWEFDED